MSTQSNNPSDSQIYARDSMSFEKTPTKCQTPSSTSKATVIDNTTPCTIQDDGCDTLFSSIDLIVTSCMPCEDDADGNLVRHDGCASPLTPKRTNNDAQVESSSTEFQRRGRFLIWSASLGLDATVPSIP